MKRKKFQTKTFANGSTISFHTSDDWTEGISVKKWREITRAANSDELIVPTDEGIVKAFDKLMKNSHYGHARMGVDPGHPGGDQTVYTEVKIKEYLERKAKEEK